MNASLDVESDGGQKSASAKNFYGVKYLFGAYSRLAVRTHVIGCHVISKLDFSVAPSLQGYGFEL